MKDFAGRKETSWKITFLASGHFESGCDNLVAWYEIAIDPVTKLRGKRGEGCWRLIESHIDAPRA